jgi:hypothetical protein
MNSRVANRALTVAFFGLLLCACGSVDVEPDGAGSSSGSGSTGASTGAGGADGLIEQRCPDVAAEAHYCVSVGVSALTLVGADTGNTCLLTELGVDVTADARSIALLDDHVQVCTGPTILQIAIADGSVVEAPHPCDGVTSDQGGLLVAELIPDVHAKEFGHYASFEDVVAGNISGGLSIGELNIGSITCMTVEETTLFVASGGSFARVYSTLMDYDLTDSGETVDLAGSDDSCSGLSATADNRLVMLHDNRLVTFDATSGAVLHEVFPVGDLAAGLHCITKP